MNLFLIAVSLFVFQHISCSWALWRRFKAGDYIIGALLPLSRGSNCAVLDERSVALVEAFIFAVNRVNADETLLPNATLGYEILDTCSNASVARTQVLSLLKQTRSANGSVARGKKAVVGVVGPEDISLSKHHVPQISFMSSSARHNKLEYKTLFRTPPSQRKRVSALVDVVCRFNWSCVNIIHSRDPSIRDTAEDLVTQLGARNVCVALSSVQDDPHQALSSLPRRGSVSVLLGDLHFVAAVFLEARKQNLTTHTWIVHEATGVMQLAEDYRDVTCGMLGLSVASADLEAFKIHLKSVANMSSWFNAGLRLGKESHERHKNPAFRKNIAASIQQWSDYVPYVIDAVLALGHGLHEVTGCMSRGPIAQRLVSSLKRISFRSVRNRTVWFDRHGDLSNDFVVMNAKHCAAEPLKFVPVGQWVDQRDGKGELTLHTEAIRWPGNDERAPIPGCTRPCGAGALTKFGPVVCQWVCYPCPRGTYRSADPTSDCKRCPAEQMPNKNQTGCVKKPLDTLRVSDGLSVFLLSLCGTGELLTISVLCVFLKFHSSHVVKASNLFFSVFTLVVLLVWFAAPVLGVGEPTDLTCQLRVVSFSLLYTSVNAALFTKTTRVVRIFRAIKGTCFLSSLWYSFLTCALILVQVTLCVVNWVIFPPQVEYNYESEHFAVPFCRQNFVLNFVSLGYNILMSLLCAWSAFSSRRLPGRYNEAKWICLAMLTCVLSWATLLIGHLVMIDGRMKTAVQSLSVTAGAYAVLIFLFFPKLHVIFFKPEKNTVKAAVASARRFSFEVATKKSLPLYDIVARRHTSPECLKLGSAISAASGVHKVSSLDHIHLNLIKNGETLA